MKRRFKLFICALLSLCVLLSLASCKKGSPAENDTTGSNESKSTEAAVPKGAVRIATAEDLAEFRDRVNGGDSRLDGVLTADIDLAPVCGEGLGNWISIGDTRSDAPAYKGIFDGGGYTISGLYSTDGLGSLFGQIEADGVVRNLTLKDVWIETQQSGAALAAEVSGRVENCHVSGTVNGIQPGGIVNWLKEGGVMSNCTFSGRVEGITQTSGIVWNNRGTVEQCRNLGEVFCVDKVDFDREASGIVSVGGGTVTGCVNEGTIWGNLAAGISVGTDALIEDCSNTGDVIGWRTAVGIAGGYEGKCTINRCVNTGHVIGRSTAAGIAILSSTVVTNCCQKGVVEGGTQVFNAAASAAGLTDLCFPDDDSNQVTVTGIAYKVAGVANCYAQGTISIENSRGYNVIMGIASLAASDGAKADNCYVTASMQGGDEQWAVAGSANGESCYYSEAVGELSEKETLQPTAPESFTDGTVADALDQWVNGAQGDYSSWVQGPDGPCFAWEAENE